MLSLRTETEHLTSLPKPTHPLHRSPPGPRSQSWKLFCHPEGEAPRLPSAFRSSPCHPQAASAAGGPFLAPMAVEPAGRWVCAGLDDGLRSPPSRQPPPGPHPARDFVAPPGGRRRPRRSAQARARRLPAAPARGGGRGCSVHRSPPGGAAAPARPSPWASREAARRCDSADSGAGSSHLPAPINNDGASEGAAHELGARPGTGGNRTRATPSPPLPALLMPPTHSFGSGEAKNSRVLGEVAESVPPLASRSRVPTHTRAAAASVASSGRSVHRWPRRGASGLPRDALGAQGLGESKSYGSGLSLWEPGSSP